jgi:hypothetical protein
MKLRFLGVFLVVLLLAVFGFYFLLTRNPVMHDPTTRDYAEWRRGKNPLFRKERMNDYLIEDIDRDSVVRGLTYEQASEKLYKLRPLSEGTGYQKFCIGKSTDPRRMVACLDTDWWCVNFYDGRATGFLLLKGC